MGSIAQRTRSRVKPSTVIAIVIAILGLMCVAYPLISTLQNNRAASIVADEMRAETDSLGPDLLGKIESDFIQYNDDLKRNPFTPGIPNELVEAATPDYDRYLKLGKPQIGEFDSFAEIVIPSVEIRLPIYKGTNDIVLSKGAGHLYGTTLPIGGEGSNTTISAHTGMATATMFDNLINMKNGDDILIHIYGKTLRYRMVDSKVVPPDSQDAIPAAGESDLDRLFLVTCTPYGLNFNRLVVEAHRIPLDADPPINDIDEVTNSIGTWQWWMTVIVIVFVVSMILIVWAVWSALNASKNRSR